MTETAAAAGDRGDLGLGFSWEEQHEEGEEREEHGSSYPLAARGGPATRRAAVVDTATVVVAPVKLLWRQDEGDFAITPPPTFFFSGFISLMKQQPSLFNLGTKTLSKN